MPLRGLEKVKSGANMSEEQDFVDFYDILQVNPNCDAKILESAYHYLAKLYHPDHAGPHEITRFNEVVGAYKVLRNPDQRAEYDKLYAQQKGGEPFRFPTRNEFGIEENSALSDADDHTKILLFLYKRLLLGYQILVSLVIQDEHGNSNKN